MRVNVQFVQETSDGGETDNELFDVIDLPDDTDVEAYEAKLNSDVRQSLFDSLSPEFQAKYPQFKGGFLGFWLEATLAPEQPSTHDDYVRKAVQRAKENLASDWNGRVDDEEVEDRLATFIKNDSSTSYWKP